MWKCAHFLKAPTDEKVGSTKQNGHILWTRLGKTFSGVIFEFHFHIFLTMMRSQNLTLNVNEIFFLCDRNFYENGGSPATSRKQWVFGLEGDVEGEGKQRGVDRPWTVDGHLWTYTSESSLSKVFKYHVTKQYPKALLQMSCFVPPTVPNPKIFNLL